MRSFFKTSSCLCLVGSLVYVSNQMSMYFAGEEAKSGEKKEEILAPAPATGEAKPEEKTSIKSDK